MTKAEQPTIDSIIQDICELDNNPFDGMGDDDVWCSLSDLRVILERNFEDHRTASLAAQDGLVEALDDATIDEIILNFAGGIVQVPSKQNPRGYVSYYRPREAMRAALSAIMEKSDG